MYELADEVLRSDPGEPPVLVRLVDARGLSARWPGEARVCFADGRRVGELLAGAIDDGLADALGQGDPAGLLTLAIGDEAAVRSGLACGGEVRLLVHRTTDIPLPVWQSFAQHADVALATEISAGTVGATAPADDPALPAAVRDAAATNRGQTWTGIVAEDGREFFVANYRAGTELLVVGEGLLAAALADQAGLLGWQATVCGDRGRALECAGRLGPADVVVVLSHDPDTDVALLATAVSSPAAYVGALGSRHTQERRRESLSAQGVDYRRVHGPAGLDIGSSTPAEVALAICAEALSVKTASPGGSLRDKSGPIHRPAPASAG